MAYAKAAEEEKVQQTLHAHGIKPLLQNRALWQSEPERPRPGSPGRSPLQVVHHEAGTRSCYDRVSNPPGRHQLAYVGQEKERETLKYRCPARHEGWACPRDERCNAGKKQGLIVRVDRAVDRRRFPPLPRATAPFERRSKGRTAVERVKGRTKVYWVADDGNLRGSRRLHAYIGVIVVVQVGCATLLARTARREGRRGDTRLSPSVQAFQEAALQGSVPPSANPAVVPSKPAGPQEQPQPDTSQP